MRVRQKLKELTANINCKIVPKNYDKYRPTLTCCCCGRTFKYRGIGDAESVAGMTYNAETDEWIATAARPVYCNDCMNAWNVRGIYDDRS